MFYSVNGKAYLNRIKYVCPCFSIVHQHRKMTLKISRQRQSKLLRVSRKIHKKTGALLFVFFFFVSVTGFLLGIKKHSGDLIMSKSFIGTSTDLKDWLPLDSLHQKACQIVRDSISPELSLKLDRIDIRKDNGMVKFVFADHFWGVQLDGATGKLLHIEKRRSDFIEKIHDGSILDFYVGTTNGQLKLMYSTTLGLALLLFTITGFWLWYGPKLLRRKSNMP